MTKFLNISTDNTLGGNSPSDETVSSQKAIKDYVDNHGGGGGSVSIDNLSITENSSQEIQTVGVINSRDTSTAIKTWTGTRQQYDAILSKDANTLYNITDDTDVSLTILEALYPVGSIYETTNATCPLSNLISGSTWVEETSRVLVDKYVSGTEWWELYSDGWCRQGGSATTSSGKVDVELSKPYSNTDYDLLTSSDYYQVGDGYNSYGYKKSNSEITVYSKSYGATPSIFVCWQTEGYTSTTTTHKRFRRTA